MSTERYVQEFSWQLQTSKLKITNNPNDHQQQNEEINCDSHLVEYYTVMKKNKYATQEMNCIDIMMIK